MVIYLVFKSKRTQQDNTTLSLYTSMCIVFIISGLSLLSTEDLSRCIFKNIHLGNKTSLGVKKTLQNTAITFVGPEGKYYSVPLAEIGILLDHGEIFTDGYHQGRQKAILPVMVKG